MAAVGKFDDPMPDETDRIHRANGTRAQGTARDAGGRRLSLGERRAAAKNSTCTLNVRPQSRSVVSGGRFENVDIVLVRENTEGRSGVEHFIAIGPDPRSSAAPSCRQAWIGTCVSH